MNSRQRLIAGLMRGWVESRGAARRRVYMMEQVTPIYQWAEKSLRASVELTGSEYLGPTLSSGTVIKGLRHEDVQNMSFAEASLDLIVSNDVLEHVPDPDQVYRECARVLAPGGEMLMTIPFHAAERHSVRRAALVGGTVENLLPPIFHGNPVSEQGSLVFTDFGWDQLEAIRAAGFADAWVDLHLDSAQGLIGDVQIVFRAVKAGDRAVG